MNQHDMIRAGSCQPLWEASSVLLAWDPLTNRDVGWLTLASGEGQEVVARLQYRDFTLRPEKGQGVESKVSREVELKNQDFEHSSIDEITWSPLHKRIEDKEITMENAEIPSHQQEEVRGSSLILMEIKCHNVKTGSGSEIFLRTSSLPITKEQSFQNKNKSPTGEEIWQVELQDSNVEDGLLGLMSEDSQEVIRIIEKDTHEGKATEVGAFLKRQRARSSLQRSSTPQEIPTIRNKTKSPSVLKVEVCESFLMCKAKKLQNVRRHCKNITDILRTDSSFPLQSHCSDLSKGLIGIQGVQSRKTKKRKQTDEGHEDRILGCKSDETLELVSASHICPTSLVAGRGEVMQPGRLIGITRHQNDLEDLDSVFRAVSALRRNIAVQVDCTNQTVDEVGSWD